MNAKLQVRQGKTVHNDRGEIIGRGGELLPLNAPIRESDTCKVVLVDADDGRTIGMDIGSPAGDKTVEQIVEVSDD